MHVMVVFLTTGLVITAGFGLITGVCIKVLGVVVIFTGTMSLNATELCETIQFLTRRYLSMSVVCAM
ncbi:MAG: hypothetical protein F2921_01020 [Actinobacteria bacterium]|uniref:Unannotated protein n=1 Tax=freshwater metagenome TaxID=449393 RepID=A0A6J7S0M0_9ZZZZ|nr:hypothetical protein [Actinomycetota bacterium]